MAFEEEQLIQSTVISIILLIIFIFSFNSQSEVDIQEFENCISQESCLYELIKVSNQTQLCTQSSNISNCYTNFAIFMAEPELCYSTTQEFECIVSVSIHSQENFCGFIRDEHRFEECIRNLIYFEIID
ncbi:MAG: hypothetical protein LAT82_05685 [Nanoarchaeota archaeon]|nr:hypothetical protein [Nanoarchaeota archaeon]